MRHSFMMSSSTHRRTRGAYCSRIIRHVITLSSATLWMLSGCGDGDQASENTAPTNNGGAMMSPSGTETGVAMAEAGVTLPTVEGENSSAGMTSGAMTEPPPQSTPMPPLTPVSSCDEFESTACFANDECASDARCQNVGSDDVPIACCVAGARGTLMTGERCSTADGQLTCASSLCISLEDADQGWCSGACLTPDDCPAQLPRCISIAFSGSDTMWCFPPEQ